MADSLARRPEPQSSAMAATVLPANMAGTVLTKPAVARALSEAVLLEFPAHARKKLARAAGMTEAGARQIVEGRNCLSLDRYLALCAARPGFEVRLKQLLGLAATDHPEFQRAMAAFARAWQQEGT